MDPSLQAWALWGAGACAVAPPPPPPDGAAAAPPPSHCRHLSAIAEGSQEGSGWPHFDQQPAEYVESAATLSKPAEESSFTSAKSRPATGASRPTSGAASQPSAWVGDSKAAVAAAHAHYQTIDQENNPGGGAAKAFDAPTLPPSSAQSDLGLLRRLTLMPATVGGGTKWRSMADCADDMVSVESPGASPVDDGASSGAHAPTRAHFDWRVESRTNSGSRRASMFTSWPPEPPRPATVGRAYSAALPEQGSPMHVANDA